MAKQITFERSLYLPEAVDAAVAAYAGHATIEVTSTGEAEVAVISATAGNDPELVANAFCNHVLHETIARLRQATSPEVG